MNSVPGANDREKDQPKISQSSRRSFLKTASVLGLVLAAPAVISSKARAAAPIGTPERPLKFSWNSGAACLSGVAIAYHNGIFEKHNLAVDLVNFSGSTDQLLEAIATGKSDAGVGMALRWLKPLEQGFDVKITSGLHGGCLRLLVSKASGITDIAGLKGKTIAVGDMAGPAKNFFSVALAKQGIDPTKDVEWRQYPANLLGLAIEKGEAQALTDNDPLTWGYRKDPKLIEIGTNLMHEYHDRTCCLIGVRGGLLKESPDAAKRVNEALLEAWHIMSASPEVAAAAYGRYAPNFTQADLVEMLRTHNHHTQVVGDTLRSQIVLYVDELKIAGVFKPTTDGTKFAKRITADIVA